MYFVLETEKTMHHAEMDTMRQKNKDLSQKLDVEQKEQMAKAAALTTMQENCNRLHQNLMNEQMKVEMLRNTISVMYQRKVNQLNKLHKATKCDID